MQGKFKKGDSVWCRPLDRMAVIDRVITEEAPYKGPNAVYFIYKMVGCEGWFGEHQLQTKDVSMFRETSANGASQLAEMPIHRACREVFSGSTAWVHMEKALKDDPLKWIELLARFHRERLDSEGSK